MGTVTMDDDDDLAYQAELARAIAASLEPDGLGPPPDFTAGPAEGAGWSALLAAGQASTWGAYPPTTATTTTATNGTGIDAGRCSPAALLSAEEEDDDYDRQIAAAVAASIKSAEEEDRRRRRLEEQAHVPPLATAAMAAHSTAPPHGPLAQPHHQQHHNQYQYHQQQQQGFRGGGGGSVCCSGGLVLVPLAAAAAAARGQGPGLAPPPPPPLLPAAHVPTAPSPVGAAGSAPGRPVPAWPVPTGIRPTEAAAAAAALMEAGMEATAGEQRGSPGPLGPTPACSPCSSAADSEAAAGAAAANRRPDVDAATSRGVAAAAAAGGPLTLLSSSPAKHARTPSLARAADAAQPQMKRSRSGGADGGAAPIPAGVGPSCAGVGRLTAVVAAVTASGLSGLQPAAAAAAARVWGGGGGGDGERAAVPLQSYSPPERPASAASGCTASTRAGDDVDCVAAAAAAWGHPDPQQQQQQQQQHRGIRVRPEPLLLSGLNGAAAADGAPDARALLLPPLQGPEQLRLRRNRQALAAGGVSAGGPRVAVVASEGGHGGVVGGGSSVGGSGHGRCGETGLPGSELSGRYALDLTSGSAGLLQPPPPQQQQQGAGAARGEWDDARQPAAGRASARRCGSTYGDAGPQGSVAPLDLSRPAATPAGGGGAFLRGSDLGESIPAEAAAPAAPCTGTAAAAAASAEEAANRSHCDPMMTDSLDALPYRQAPASSGTAAAGNCEATAAAASPGWGWSYSGADRRLLMHQRVWWWLGPGQVQIGRICSIDRRSEPLLYSVRLDADGAAPAEAGQTIIATADCLFPYLSHGDKLMCRLPPSTCDDDGGSGSGGALLQQGQQQQRWRRLEEWPGYGGREVGARGASAADGGDCEAAAAAAAAASSCAWMCGVLQHCIFDGRSPMVHVLLGPEGLPYSAPYEYVVPVSDAAEGSGCATPGSALVGPPPPGCYGPVYDTTYNNALDNDSNAGACRDIVPIGPAA